MSVAWKFQRTGILPSRRNSGKSLQGLFDVWVYLKIPMGGYDGEKSVGPARGCLGNTGGHHVMVTAEIPLGQRKVQNSH